MQVVDCNGASASNEILSLLHPAGRKKNKGSTSILPTPQCAAAAMVPRAPSTLLLEQSGTNGQLCPDMPQPRSTSATLSRHATAHHPVTSTSATLVQTCHSPHSTSATLSRHATAHRPVTSTSAT
ncbi:hypothetical protein LEMLEM_LOCUS12940, partial [Lemmus lemmus]